MSELWTPPKHVYRGGAAEHGQLMIPGIGVDHQRPQHGRYVREGDDLYKQQGNPHVWGSIAGHHNPFHSWDMGENLANGYHQPASYHEWEQHDHKGYDQSQRHLQNLTDKAHLATRVSTDVFHKILNDGRMKSQFETNSSNGMLNHATRAGVEDKHFGYPDHIREWSHLHDTGYYDDQDDEHPGEHPGHPSHARPIYGYLTHKPLESDNASQYGEHKLILHKPSMAHRTSVTFGDSLNGHEAIGPSPLQKVSPYSFHGSVNDDQKDPYGYSEDDDPPHKRIMALKHFDHSSSTGSIYGGDPHDEHPKGLGYNYAEAQFHGGVKTSDIHYAVLSDHTGHTDLKQRLHEHGIPWVEADRTGHVWGHSGDSSKKALFKRHSALIDSYDHFMKGHAMGKVRVIAQQGESRFLLADHNDPNGMVRLADTTAKTLSGELPLQSFLGRGYWEDPQPGIGAHEILSLVGPSL